MKLGKFPRAHRAAGIFGPKVWSEEQARFLIQAVYDLVDEVNALSKRVSDIEMRETQPQVAASVFRPPGNDF